MKKKILITCLSLIAIFLILFTILYCSKLYYYMFYNGVFDYGKTQDIYEILGDKNIDLGEYESLAKYKYKKVVIKSFGSTTNKKIKIKNNSIVVLGNRNLIGINDKLYMYIDKKE